MEFSYPHEPLSTCLTYVKNHDIDEHGCKTCSRILLMAPVHDVIEGPKFVFPLRNGCLRGKNRDHDAGCTKCANAKELMRCASEITAEFDNLSSRAQLSLPLVVYCAKHERHENIHPEVKTLCSECLSRVKPRRNCRVGRHYMCTFHSTGFQKTCCTCRIERQGQVASHQTGNHETNTSAGGNVSIVNYYGTAYTAANNPNQMKMDPEAIGSAVGNATSGAMAPFLNSPTVETLGDEYSDRILTLIAGNSAIITQESAGGVVCAYGSIPSYLETTPNTVDLPSRPGPSCDRIYTLPSIEWDTTSTGWQVPFPGALSNMGVFGQNLQFHNLYRAGFAVHVQCNATQFHAGCLLVAVVPECEVRQAAGSNYTNTHFFETSTIAELPLLPREQLTLFPHQYINLRSVNTCTIMWPFNNVVPASSFTTHNICRILVVPITPLQQPTGLTPRVPITISIQPVCSQFNGLRNHVAVPQGIPTFGIPGDGQFSTIAPNDGIPAYAVWTDVPTFPLAGRLTNFLSVLQIPTICHLNYSSDHPIYVELNNSSTNQKIFEMDVSPMATGLAPTYLSRMCRAFSTYRGSIVLRLVYTGPRQSSGKLLIAYTPPGGQAPTTREDAMLGTHVIWDIGLQSTLVFTIPYISVSPYRFANRSGDIFSYNGFVTGWYQTDIIVAPGIENKATMFCTVAAGSDFSLHCMMDTDYFATREGLGDDLSGMITGMVHQALESALTTATMPKVQQMQVTNTTNVPAIQSGGSTALEAAETGTSHVANPADSMLVDQKAVVNHSWRETGVEAMLSRYYGVYDTTIENGIAFLNLNPEAYTGSIAFSRLLTLATYWRFDLDIVAVLTAKTDIGFQMMFSPPGSRTNANRNNWPAWNSSNPSIIGMSNKPVTMRIPWTSTASYFCSSFDGFGSFDGTNYTVCPSNELGYLGFRTLLAPTEYGLTTDNHRLRVYMRPVNIQAYMPRPIGFTSVLSLRPNYDLGAAHRTAAVGRIEVGDPLSFTVRNVRARRQGPELDEMPLEYPEGREMSGVWINREYYWLPGVVLDNGIEFAYTRYVRSKATYAPTTERTRHDTFLIIERTLVKAEFDPDGAAEYIAENFMIVHPTILEHNRLFDIYVDTCQYIAERRRILYPDEGYQSEPEPQGPVSYITTSLAEAMASAFQQTMSNTAQTIKDCSKDWWKTVLQIVTKFVSCVLILMRSKGDPTIIASVAALMSADLMSMCPFEWLQNQICNIFGIKSRQGPVDWIKNFNTLVAAGKALDWLFEKFSKIIEWLKVKIVPQLEDLEKDENDVTKLSGLLRDWRDAKIYPEKYTDADIEELANTILHLRDILIQQEPNCATLRYSAKFFTECEHALANMKRRTSEPIGVLIHGSPGTGKSIATTLLGKCLSKRYGHSLPYSLPPDPKYFDNYQGQAVVIMDDLGQNPDGEDMKLLCQMISSTDFVTPQADLADKGKYFTSRVILASTNCQSLAPPTVAAPKALRRRFKFDVDIEPSTAYLFDDGTLDLEKATKMCDHPSLNYSACCPFICGKAVMFRDRKTKELLSLDLLTTRIQTVDRERRKLASSLDVYCQGRVVGQIRGRRRQLPAELRELIESDPAPGKPMLQYAYDLGYDIPDELAEGVVLTETVTLKSKWKNWAIGAATLLGILTTLYFVWRAIPARDEGPYETGVQRRLLKPIPRQQVETQGNPDAEFAASLMRHNLFNITTGTGNYTVLGVFGQTVLMPKHAAVGPYYLKEKELTISKEYDLTKNGANLELTMIEFKELQEFRDLRKFFPEKFEPISDAVLALNCEATPRMFMPIKKIYNYGVLNLEGEPTHNTIYYVAATKKGYCGGVIVKAGKIYGMHIAGDGVCGYAAGIYSHYFAEQQGKIVKEYPAMKPVNVNRKTKLQPSVWHDLIDVKKEPAVLSQRDKRCEVDFEKNLFRKYKGNVEFGIFPELDEAIEQYAEQLRPIIPRDVAEELTLEEVCEGYGRLEGLDLNTSAGYPYCTNGMTKRKLMANGRSKLIEGLDLYGYNLPMVTALKDELRPIAKVKDGNTRLIECSSINDTILMKKKCGRFFEAMISNPGTTTGSAVGCNPDVDWTRFAVELGNNVNSYDYKNFDASLSPGFFKALIKLLNKIGLNVDELIINICNSTHIYGSKQYDVQGGMPSGCSGTSIFNTLINNLILKTCVLMAYKGIDLDRLKILAYGDDVLFSYPFPLDAALIAEMGKVLGLTMTPADKGEKFKEAGPLEEHTFLKRGFKPDEKHPTLIHPVFDLDDIFQSLAWTRDPSNTQEHILSLCQLAWHSGERDYKIFTELIRSVPIGRVLNIPPYKTLLRQWYDSF